MLHYCSQQLNILIQKARIVGILGQTVTGIKTKLPLWRKSC